MKYLRRYSRSEKAELREWQEVSESIAMNIAKVVTPPHSRALVSDWLHRGIMLGNNFVQVKFVSDEYAEKLMNEDEILARQAGGEAVPA